MIRPLIRILVLTVGMTLAMPVWAKEGLPQISSRLLRSLKIEQFDLAQEMKLFGEPAMTVVFTRDLCLFVCLSVCLFLLYPLPVPSTAMSTLGMYLQLTLYVYCMCPKLTPLPTTRAITSRVQRRLDERG